MIRPATPIKGAEDAHVLGVLKFTDSNNRKASLEVYVDRAFAWGEAFSLALQQQPKLKLNQLDTLLSTIREFDAIKYMGDHPLLPGILRGEFSTMRELGPSEDATIARHISLFSHQLNSSQQAALKLDDELLSYSQTR